MKKIAFAAIAATSLSAAPLIAGNISEPQMEPEVIQAEAVSSSSNQAEIVALTLTALIFVTALISAN